MKVRKQGTILAALLLTLALTGCGAQAQHTATVAPATSTPPTITAGVSEDDAAASDTGAVSAETSQTPDGSAAAGTQQETASTEPVQQKEEPAPVMTGYLSQQEVLEIAYDHAGVSGDQLQELSCELDDDEHPAKYEIEFQVGHHEYEFEINAEDGTILDYEKKED